MLLHVIGATSGIILVAIQVIPALEFGAAHLADKLNVVGQVLVENIGTRALRCALCATEFLE